MRFCQIYSTSAIVLFLYRISNLIASTPGGGAEGQRIGRPSLSSRFDAIAYDLRSDEPIQNSSFTLLRGRQTRNLKAGKGRILSPRRPCQAAVVDGDFLGSMENPARTPLTY